MKKLNKVAMIVATVAAVAPMSSVFAQATTAPGRIDNWRNVDGNVWKNDTRELCWRDNFWTPATAVAGIELYAVCSRRALRADDKQREKAQNELAQQEFEILAKRHLRDLMQDAHIEYR